MSVSHNNMLSPLPSGNDHSPSSSEKFFAIFPYNSGLSHHSCSCPVNKWQGVVCKDSSVDITSQVHSFSEHPVSV